MKKIIFSLIIILTLVIIAGGIFWWWQGREIKGGPKDYVIKETEVPDLGIRVLSFWERNILKPIITQIKEVEVIITKVTGKSPKIVEKILRVPQAVFNFWNKFKSAISKFNPFGAGMVYQTSPSPAPEAPGRVGSGVGQDGQKVNPPDKSQSTQTEDGSLQTSETGTEKSKPLTPLEEIQENLDDIAEKVDILTQKVAELVASQKEKIAKEKTEEKEIEKQKEETKKKETEICQPNSININTASKEELQKIAGIGQVLAQRIIEARPFSSLEDLLRVSGIGPATLQKIIGQGCAYVVGFAASGAPVPPTYPKILISEVQIEGNDTNHDFIELYNPNNSSLNISGYKLRKRTSGGTEYSIQVLPSGSIIPAKGYYLWASSEDKNYPSSINANVSTTQTLAPNNSIALLAPDDTIISALAWGTSTNPFVETSPFPRNPGKNQSLGRIWDEEKEEYKDTNNNSTDFEIQTPTPKAKNQSPVPQPPTPPLSVVINEIAWMGTNASPNDEWIELHNTTKNSIDLTGWTLVSLTDDTPHITLSGTIPPLGFYLLERTASSTTDVSEDQIYRGSLSNDPNCEILALYDSNNNLIDKTACREEGNKYYWPAGKASPDYISMERIDPRSSGENANNWLNNNQIIKNGLDAKNNPIKGTPRAQNSVYQTLPPEAVSDFAIDFQNSFANKVKLTWSPATDPDTLSENLFYKIYYSKDIPLTENNLEATSTLFATTSTTTITISDLDYNSIYYFGIRAFDGQNYSPLTTTTPYQTPILATIASGFSNSDLNPNNLKNNGRKIARASNGDLYVVYSQAGKIFLAKSINQGRDWTKIDVTPQEQSEQINPSIAIDSQNNLHIVWQGKVGSSTVYQIRYRKYDGNTFSEIENLTNNSEWNQEIPVIAIDSQNHLHLVWVNNHFWQPKILHRVFTGQWQEPETTGNSQETSIASLALAIDSQDNLHLVWQANRLANPTAIIQYQKRTAGGWGTSTQLDYDDIQADFPSLAIDSQGKLHIVWHSLKNLENQGYNSKINYLKYTEPIEYENASNVFQKAKGIEILDQSSLQWTIASPSIALDSRDHLYVIWKRLNEKISIIEYSDSWGEVKNLNLGSQNSFAFTNLLWSFYPQKTNQPKTGFAFVFYEGTELKFYSSQNLIFE